MDVSSIATGLASAQIAGGVQTSVLKSVENLAADQVARLFNSLGLGQNVDTLA
ncbi:MAG: hypothetical protein NVSMB31_11180 [Vulcanimicrobiaceae bacterium]